MNKKQLEIITSFPRKYGYCNYIISVKRVFAVSGSTILEQTVSMLLDEMEKRKEYNYGNETKL